MAEVTLNWATSEVEDGKLTVDLDGEIPKGWRDSFEATVRLLGHGDWGKVRVKKQAVRVSEVVPGSEEKGALDSSEPSGPDGPDAEMAERFRSFAEPEHQSS